MADKKDKRSRTPATAADLTPDAGEKGAAKTDAAPPTADQAAAGLGTALVAEAAAAAKRKPRKAGGKKEEGKVERRRRPKTTAVFDQPLADSQAAEGKGIGEALVAQAAAEPRRRGRPRNPPLPPGEKPARSHRPAGDKPRRRYQPGRQRVPPGYLVTGVRVDERLSPMLLALARANGQEGGRSASLTSIACTAMRSFAAANGVELSEVEISASRRDDDVLGDRASRRLWVKYPEGWKAGIDELMLRNPALNHTADLWRSALVELARASGIAA